MFPFVLVPHRMDVAGGRRAGQFAGALGGKYDPLLTGGNPNDDKFKLDHLPLAPNDSADALQAPARPARSAQPANHGAERAGHQPVDPRQPGPGAGRDLVGGGAQGGRPGRRASRRSEPATAATCSASRCCWASVCWTPGPGWCSATGSARRARTASPGTRTGTISRPTRKTSFRRFDLAFDALMTDLEKTGQLDETLVVVAAEFGRSPKVTRSNAGREHWPECYSVLFAGGGIKGGAGSRPVGQERRLSRQRIRPRRPTSRRRSTTAWASIRARRRTTRAAGRWCCRTGKPIATLVG